MTTIVTGGSGMLGKHLQEISPNYIYLSSKDCDLTDKDQVLRLFDTFRPQRVVHLAAKVGGILQNMSHPADFFDQNVTMNSNVLIAARKFEVPNFLSVLSTCMYPDVVSRYPMTEEDIHKGPPASANLSYAYTKRCMAVQMDAYNKQLGLNYNYLIPCNLFGEHDNFSDSNKSHFVTALIKKIIDSEMAGKKEITLFGTGMSMRQFMYAGDLAMVIKKVIEDDIKESFNVAPPGQNYSINQMALMSLEALGKTDWRITYDNDKPDGQFRKDVSSDKMMKAMGNFNFTEFSEGVIKVYNKIKQRGI
jgi:GDP-L-fucose synthase